MERRFETGCVASARDLSPGFRNVTIVSAALAGSAFTPGADVVIRLPVADGRGNERRYSVWKSSSDPGSFDVCVTQHGLGPGSRWAAGCAAGDPIEFARSPALPIAADHSAAAHVLLGDETSIASADALIRNLPIEAVVLACFELASSELRWPAPELVRPDTVQWVERAGRPGAALLARLEELSIPAADRTTVYVTGEAWLCAMVHSHFVRTRRFRADAVRAMPYWKMRPQFA